MKKWRRMLNDYQNGLSEDEKVKAFIEHAREYCSLIENHESVSVSELIQRSASLLPALYKYGVELPYVFPDSEDLIEDTITHQNWKELFARISERLGDYNFCRYLFNPYEDKEVIEHSLADDFADIYRDIKDGLVAFDKGSEEFANIIWHWQFNFEGHWGHHLVAALRAIHELIVERPFDDQE